MPPIRPASNNSFNNAYRPGKARISSIIDFGQSQSNRYLRINQSNSKTSLRSTNSYSRHHPHLAAFKNPLLNSYDDDGDEDYEPKHFDIDFDDNSKSQRAIAVKGSALAQTSRPKRASKKWGGERSVRKKRWKSLRMPGDSRILRKMNVLKSCVAGSVI